MKFSALVAIAAFLLSLTNAQAQRRSEFDGSIVLDDGRSVVRINVGDRSDRAMAARIRRLEAAVRDLQDVVYDLQSQQPREAKFACQVTTCRHSTSIHSASGNNCTFFNMWRKEKITVWGNGGSDAERKAVAVLEADKDIAAIQGRVSCDYE